MKKYLSVIFVLVIICTICVIYQKHMSRYDSLIEQESPLYSDIGLNVYEIDDSYLVIIGYNGKITKSVEFSAERVSIEADRINLLQIDDIRELLGKALSEIEKQYGSIHVDTGSGFYIPSYVTSDGYLVKMWVEDDVIAHVSRIDLLTGEGIEWYSMEGFE